MAAAAIASAGLEMAIEERDGIADRLDLHGVGVIDALRITLYVDEAVHVVLVGRPCGIFTEFDQQVVADPENPLKLVAIAALYQDGRVDRAHAFPGNVLGDPWTHFLGLSHQ